MMKFDILYSKEEIALKEGLFIGTLMHNLQDIGGMRIESEKFMIPSSAVLFKLLEYLYVKGNSGVTQAIVESALIDNDALVYSYRELGGYKTINELLIISEGVSFETAYSDWQKLICLKDLEACNVVLKEEYKHMSMEQIYGEVEGKIMDCFLQRVDSSKVTKIEIDDMMFEELISGMEQGVLFNCVIQPWVVDKKGVPYRNASRMNNSMLGLPRGDLTLLAGYTGTGKSTYAVNNLIVPALLENEEESALFIINEMDKRSYIRMILSALVFCLCEEGYKFDRRGFKSGSFKEYEIDMLKVARDFYNEHLSDRLFFLEMHTYNSDIIVKELKRSHAVNNITIFLLDTFKGESSDLNAWMHLKSDSKKIYQCTKKLNLAGILTMQLALSNLGDARIINHNHLGESKGVLEVIAEVIYFRHLDKEEKTVGSDYYVSPTHFDDYKNRIVKELDVNKEYVVTFHQKSRSNSIGTQLVYEFKSNVAYFYEIGYGDVKLKKHFKK